MPPASGAPGPSGTVDADGLWLCMVWVGLGEMGLHRPDVMLNQVLSDAEGGSVVSSPMQPVQVIWFVGPHVGHEVGGHIPPQAGVLHGGGRGGSPFTEVEYDVRHGAGAGPNVVYVHEDPPGPNLDGELLHVGYPGGPQVWVNGRCAVRLRGGALGLLFGLCVVQALLCP